MELVLTIVATIALTWDWRLTLSPLHNGVEYEVNPLLKAMWRKLGGRGVSYYFVVWIAAVWVSFVAIGESIHMALCVAVIIASYFGIRSIKKNPSP